MNNSSILILVLLVLYFIYTNLENNTSMKGGTDVNNIDIENMVKKVTDNDFIYQYTIGTTHGLIIYASILIILIGVGIYYGRQSMYVNGTTLPGIGKIATGYSMVDWMVAGLYKFYNVRQDTYFYKNVGTISSSTSKKDEAEFIDLIKDLRTEKYKDSVHYFCDKVLPCDSGAVNTACTCKGPDGKQLPQCESSKEIRVEDRDGNITFRTDGPALKIAPLKQELAKSFFGIIPKCCCTKIGRDVIKENAEFPNIASNLKIELSSCTTGEETGEAFDAEVECAGVDCSNEPDYTLLSIPLYDEDGKISKDWIAEASKYPSVQDIIKNPEIESDLSSKINNQVKLKSDDSALLTNPKENFTGNSKKISPYAKIIDAQIKRLEHFKQPDNIKRLLTEAPVKSKKNK